MVLQGTIIANILVGTPDDVEDAIDDGEVDVADVEIVIFDILDDISPDEAAALKEYELIHS